MRIDEDGFPIVHVSWSEAPTVDEVRACLDVHVRLIARGERFGVIHDARAVSTPPPKVGNVVTAFTNDLSREQLEHLHIVVVHDSRLLHGIITAIRWLTRNRSRLNSTRTLEEAEAIIRRFIEAGERPRPGEASPESPGR